MEALLPMVLGAPSSTVCEWPSWLPTALLALTYVVAGVQKLLGKASGSPSQPIMLQTVEAAARQLGFQPSPSPLPTQQGCRFVQDGVELVASEHLSIEGEGTVERFYMKLCLSYGAQGRSTSLPRTQRCCLYQPSWATMQRTGDHDFDAVFAVQGSQPQAAAALDFETRALALSLQARGMKAELWGTLELVLVEPAFDSVRSAVTDLVSLAGKLALDGPAVPAALARVAREDPVSGVQAGALGLLHEHFPMDPSTQPLLLEALRSAIPEVALAGAKAMEGQAGREVLFRLAADSTSEAVRSEALAAISDLRDPRVESTLIRALEANTPQVVVLEAVRALATAGSAAAIGPLRQVQARYDAFAPVAAEVRRSIRQIHARLGFELVGAVALAERAEIEGALATSGPTGQLAVAPDTEASERA